MTTHFIVAAYCMECKIYSKHIGSGYPTDCDVCGSERVLQTVARGSVEDPNMKEEVVNICYGENPRYSASLGVTETQIEEAMKLHPGTDFKRFGHSFRPLIRNRAHKLEVMKQAGYEEFDTKQFKGRQ